MGTDRQRASEREPALASRLTAEFFGTFALTLTACAVEIVAATHPDVSHLERAAAPALAVLAVIYAVSDVSGAHINPAVTLGFALRGVFEWRRAPGYWLAQALGALAGAGTARQLVGTAGDLGATRPNVNIGAGTAVLIEAVLTFLLVSVVLHTSKRKAAVGPQAALAVGATIALCGFWGGPLTGASMNPARSFGPAMLAGRLDTFWIYVLGPILGMAAAVAVTFVIHGRPSGEEEKAAKGE
jgi:MIP family channel proteins